MFKMWGLSFRIFSKKGVSDFFYKKGEVGKMRRAVLEKGGITYFHKLTLFSVYLHHFY